MQNFPRNGPTVPIANLSISGWFDRLVARKFDRSRFRHPAGRPQVDEAVEDLAVQMAQENPAWGQDPIVGALRNVGTAPAFGIC